MEYKFQTLSKFKKITLSPEEKALLRARMAAVLSMPAESREPYIQVGIQHGLRIVLSSLIFVIFVGGGISAVASNALPGDDLYAFKTGVNEEIKAALLNTTEKKIAFQKSLVEKRVGEIKTLAESKTLTKEKQAKAQAALDNNIEDLSVQLTLLADQSPNTALSVTANLEESLKANKEEIKNTIAAKDESAAAATIETIDGTLKKVSQEEVKILSKELEKITDEAEATSTDAPIIESQENSNAGTDDNSENSDEESSNENRDQTSSITPSTTPVSP